MNTNNQINKNILFVTYYYPPIFCAGSQRMIKIIRYLDIREIYVLTVKLECYPNDQNIQNNQDIPIKNERVYRTKTYDYFGFLLRIKSKITSFLCMSSNTPQERVSWKNNVELAGKHGARTNFINALKDIISGLLCYPDFASSWFIPSVLKGFSLVRKKKVDIIFATGWPWSSLVIGAILKTFTRKKLVIEFRDPWVNNPYINRNTNLENWLDKVTESFVVSRADLVFLNTDALKDDMESRYPHFRSKMMVLPNGYDPVDFQNLPTVSLPKDKFVICHTGMLYLARDPMCIFNAVEYIKKKYPDYGSLLRFYQIGPISLDYDYMEICRKKKIEENIIFFDLMEHAKSLGYLSESDMLLIIQPNTKVQIPSKLYEYIYLNKPILTLTEKDGTLGRLVKRNNLGKVFDPSNYKNIAEYLVNAIEIKKESGKLTSTYELKDIFDFRNIIKTLEKQLNDL